MRVVIHKGISGTAEVLQERHYYPFGMEMSELSYNYGSNIANKYLYNGKEMQNDYNLYWYDYGARMYDPALGRWHVPDPLAEMYGSYSPYNYAMNNPVRYIDIDGMYSTAEWMKDNGVTQDDLITIYQAPSDDNNESEQEESHFDDLWDNYPSKSPKHEGPNGKDIFGDHCAINLSEALIKSGMNLDGYKGTTCWGKCPSGKSGSHAIRAQELASYLKDIKKLPVKELTGENFEEYVAGKTGIIFFKNYWQRSGETGNTRTGDHIDLWNKNELASIGLVLTFIRRTFPEISENYFSMSDLRKSKQVLFFEIK